MLLIIWNTIYEQTIFHIINFDMHYETILADDISHCFIRIKKWFEQTIFHTLLHAIPYGIATMSRRYFT